jgi:hypothetical protein
LCGPEPGPVNPDGETCYVTPVNQFDSLDYAHSIKSIQSVKADNLRKLHLSSVLHAVTSGYSFHRRGKSMSARTTATDRSTVSIRLGVCAAALGGTAATSGDANGQVVTFNTPINLPQTVAGVYINLLTGATGSSGASVTGWDFNPYLAGGGAQLGFYWSQTPANTSGGVASGTTYQSLTDGTVVGPASTFTGAILGTTGSPYLTSGTHNLGFRFQNENTNTINYGFLNMTTTAGTPGGYPAVINFWQFESGGGPITVAPIPEPSTVGLTCAAMALGARGVRRWRRERAATQAA